MRSMAKDGQKLVPLEGLRGIAAAIVVLYHLVLAFTPKGVGVVPHGHGPLDVIIQFILGLLNGGAAVAVFFVLSGFILSLPFARDRRLSRILVAMLKRWPRLAGLTVLACLFAWVLIHWSGHHYTQAASVIGSGWLATHGNAPISPHRLTWWGAVTEGLFSAFTTGNVRFDSPLWTMRIELFGSFAIFLAAPVLFAIGNWWLRIALIGTVMICAGGTYPITYLSDFLIGTILAMLFAEDRLPVLADWQAWVAGLLAIYLFSFTYEQKLLIHAPLKAIMPAGDTSHFIWDAGAALMIIVLLGNPFMRRAFSKGWAVWLGLLSFPIYLLHGPILLSIGATSFLSGLRQYGFAGSAILAALLSITLTLLCALPMIWLDKIWTRLLGRITGRLVQKPAAPIVAPVKVSEPARPKLAGECPGT
jgi:peptidoglycan/LPS O-acetylase OafA/YrhL